MNAQHHYTQYLKENQYVVYLCNGTLLDNIKEVLTYATNEP